jgi:hypothetical protein
MVMKRALIISFGVLSTLGVFGVIAVKVFLPPGLTTSEALSLTSEGTRQMVCASQDADAVRTLEDFTEKKLDKEDNSDFWPERIASLRSACAELAKSDPFIRQIINTKKKEDRRFTPELAGWNEKAEVVGGGSYPEFLEAKASVNFRVRSGTITNTFTGIEQEVQAVECGPSIRSRWINGIETGWWRCAIDLLGYEIKVYSVEVSPNSLRANSDSGAQALSGVNFETPKGFDDWVLRNCDLAGSIYREFCNK